MELTADAPEPDTAVPVPPHEISDDTSDETVDVGDLAPIDRPIETPEADLIDQLRDAPLADEHDR